jgi:N-carbamoyl-L-amino-acid hydrolase
VGRVDVQPGAPNVIPGCVLLDVEIRGLDELLLDAAEAALRLAAEAQGGAFTGGHCKAPVPADPALFAVVERVCRRLGIRHQPMSSGAGHDAMNMARVCPYAMIFVPSEAGISHAPAEYTAAAECIDGVRVLLATLLELDSRI